MRVGDRCPECGKGKLVYKAVSTGKNRLANGKTEYEYAESLVCDDYYGCNHEVNYGKKVWK